ncbi:hypothetical protein PMZ80_011017 [Knufia obscura]|uniref:Enolase n=2 Tax=Trichomeriaceae TaxID=1233474 RepID=A0ABR0JVB3_9EURO|nr:hypothetical protein LTR24_010108 [Lithohypha guttulata]KAK5093975.1 hypothetical protein LTS08_008779 [Lithohypha guttulata]KAK5309599.1 hypothetical protein LTR70_010151 [Exophiala xenobiotica]KAK5936754.1 hypothetical protein PMZ80_011017 [Knufia obscura]
MTSPSSQTSRSLIQSVSAAERLDSRGKPTVQVTLTTEKGRFSSLVPSGASKGDYEAIELRDGDNSRYHGQGVTNAVKNVIDTLGPKLIAKKFCVGTQQREIDDFMCELDGSDDKSALGANAILGISMAVARAGAAAKGVPLYEHLAQVADRNSPYVLPVPFFNVLNGGVHSGNPMAFQEMMVAPVGATSMKEAVRWGSETYQSLKSIITSKFGKSAIGIGDEGGFAPPTSEPHEALDLLIAAIKDAGHEGKIKIGVDPASQEFYEEKSGTYNLGMKWDTAKSLSKEEMRTLYHKLLDKYPIVLLEDPFGQDDWEAWTAFNEECPVELVGDDLLATNIRRIEEAHEKKACNALLLKINQIGSITESIDAAKRAYELGWSVFVSHRSGETTDDFIADLTVALATGHLKSGSPCRGERVAKYNRLMDIEDELEARNIPNKFAGVGFRTAHQA